MFLLRLLSYLPFRILYPTSDLLYFFLRYAIRYRRKLVRKNLRNSFPGKSGAELLSIEKQFYKNLCDYGVETLKLLTMKKEHLAARVRFTNLDLIQSYKEKNEPLILLSAHLFNWEWILTAGSFSLPIPLDFVYQKVKSNLFNTFAMVTRTRFGAFPIERSNVARETIKRKDFLRGIALVADQYPGYAKDKKYSAFFLNQETVLFLGGNQLAILMQYPVLYMNVKKIRRGYYEGTFEKIADPPYGKDNVMVVENYVRALEKSILADPSNWLWSHNRWKKRHLNSNTSPSIQSE